MKILMISDLHICEYSHESFREIYHKLDKIFEIINVTMGMTEQLIIVMCGDIVDNGRSDYYSSAEKVFDYIIKKAENRNIEFIMAPGNHDLCNESFKAFDTFSEKYSSDSKAFVSVNCYSRNIEDVNFILVNSTYHKDYEYGKVDIDSIGANVDPQLTNILITHHSTISEDDQDTASIRNVPRLLDIINKYNIAYHLHGHTHGTYLTRIGHDCTSIGVGAMFHKAEEMGSQFHIITINGGEISQIHNYYYRIDRDKYIQEELELKAYEKTCETSEMRILKEESECPAGYIKRLVGPFDIVQRGEISLTYNREKLKPLYTFLREKKRIVLIGEAGTGKSYELQNLTRILLRDCEVRPIFIELNTYVDETIETLVEIASGDKGCISNVLIFDSYDEIEAANLNVFARRLNRFIKFNPEQKIVISTRNNFYRNALDDTTVGTFNDFYECSLCPLTMLDIESYLGFRNIDIELFMDEVKNKKLKEQLTSPFFLIQITNLFSSEGCLPHIEELMDKLIDSSFKQDEIKYIVTKDVQDQNSEMINQIQIIAFSMQCLKRNFIENDEYHALVDEEIRDLLKYCGIWKRVGENKWKFEHNNFREYLAAQYIKHETLEEIVNLVTFPDNNKEIKNSWINVLTFLVLIYPSRLLIDWLAETAPSIVVSFESTRLDEEIRGEILCVILEKYKNDNMWISRDQNSEDELAKFGQSENSIDYLIKEIYNPYSLRAKSNAIHILGKMTNYFGKEIEVREALFNCCFGANSRNYEIRSAIMALTNNLLYNEEDITTFLEYFKEIVDSDIRYALYCYIIEYQLQDISIDFVLEGIDIKERSDDEFISNFYRIKEITESLQTSEAIHKVFTYILRAEDYHKTIHYFDDALEGLCSKSESLYEENGNQLLTDLQNIFIKASKEYESKSTKTVRTFLTNSNKVFKTYELIMEMPSDNNTVFLLEDIMDAECVDDFANKYKNSLLNSKDVFVSYVSRCEKSDYKYNELINLVFQVDKITITEREIIDYKSISEEGFKNYFDALFDKSMFQMLIGELAEVCNGVETTYDNLKHINIKKTEKRYDLDKVKRVIQKNSLDDQKIVNFLSYINWEQFAISEIYLELKNNKELIIEPNQVDYIKNYYHKTINEINFEKEITYKKDGGTTFTWRVIWCMYFVTRFSIEIDKNILFEMINVPQYIFGKTNSGEIEFASYVLERLNEDELNKQICYNLQNLRIEGTLAEIYIKYCNEKKLKEAFNLANSIINDIEYSEWIRRQALEYMLNISGVEYVVDNYLGNADETLLKIIIDKLASSKNSKLLERLEQENKGSEDGMLHLQSLILMDSSYGLNKYYEISNKLNAIPDLSEKGNIAPITEAIEEVSDEKNIDIIIKLARLVYKNDFKDQEYFGLHNSVAKSIKNIAQYSPQLVMERLEYEKSKINDNPEFIGFCNYNLVDIRTQFYNEQDSAWNMDEVIRYVY